MCNSGLKLSPMISDGMILQRDTVNYIYGSDYGVDEIVISFNGVEYRSGLDENSEFKIPLPPIKAGGPYDLTVKGSSEIIIRDILFGDVYICCGQSNMELPIRRVLRVSEQEVLHTDEPTIRQYLIPATYNFAGPEKYVPKSSWQKAGGEALLDFSAVGFFFAKELKERYQIPIGLIMTAVGGSTVEAWMNPATLARFGDYDSRIKDFKDINYFNTFIKEQQEAAAVWGAELECEEDKFRIDENYKEWSTCHIPALVSDYSKEPFQGSLYLCKEILLEREPDDKATLSLGAIIDSDMVWVNGTLVGRTEYRYPPRVYSVPRGVLKKGSNLITVRIVINNGNGGTVKGMPYQLDCGSEAVSLEGEWYCRIGKRKASPMPNVLFPPLLPISFYHTVLVPLSLVAVKGVLWYQGESNTGAPSNYSALFEAFVSDFRTLFGWSVPFLYVQLTNYKEPLNTTEDTGWAEIREQQRRSLSLDQVAMAVTLDIGEYCDLHPQNKKEVGLRLAKAAFSLIYNEVPILNSPLPEAARVEENRVMISFRFLEDDHREAGIRNFELAQADGVYYPADADRIGRSVIVSCDRVSKPAFVRYAWYDNPMDINFYNEQGLPAPCFRLEL